MTFISLPSGLHDPVYFTDETQFTWGSEGER